MYTPLLKNVREMIKLTPHVFQPSSDHLPTSTVIWWLKPSMKWWFIGLSMPVKSLDIISMHSTIKIKKYLPWKVTKTQHWTGESFWRNSSNKEDSGSTVINRVTGERPNFHLEKGTQYNGFILGLVAIEQDCSTERGLIWRLFMKMLGDIFYHDTDCWGVSQFWFNGSFNQRSLVRKPKLSQNTFLFCQTFTEYWSTDSPRQFFLIFYSKNPIIIVMNQNHFTTNCKIFVTSWLDWPFPTSILSMEWFCATFNNLSSL